MKVLLDNIVAAIVLFLIGVLVLVIGTEIVTNISGFHTVMEEAHGFVRDLIESAFEIARAAIIIWLSLKFAEKGVTIWKERNIIRPGVHGPAQAVIHQNTMVQLASPTQVLDPAASAKSILQAGRAMRQETRQFMIDELRMEPEKPKEIEGPKEHIPAVVMYSSVSGEVPDELSLLGIHPESGQLEIVSPENLKTAWFVGGSNMGKTNTVYGKVGDAKRWGARMIFCDNHAYKPDSLTNKLKDFHGSLLIPIAQTDEDIKRAVIMFLKEFHARRDGLKTAYEKWLIVCDEVNATGNHVVQLTAEEELWLYERYGYKVENGRIKLMVLFKFLAETCGYEARGFDMFGYFISQKVAGLAWLRNAMMTVFVHGLLTYSEALLAANNKRKNAELVMKFKKGRVLVYGYEIEEMILQQPLYEMNVVESTIESSVQSDSTQMESTEASSNQAKIENVRPDTEPLDRTLPFDLGKFKQAQKMLLAQRNQNEIICEVWNVQENTRAFRAAKEEFRLMLAYLASMVGEE
jgi:hypothetical protein